MATTLKNTCPLCGSKRDGRNLDAPCPQPQCRLTHAEALAAIGQPTGRVFIISGFPIVEVK